MAKQIALKDLPKAKTARKVQRVLLAQSSQQAAFLNAGIRQDTAWRLEKNEHDTMYENVQTPMSMNSQAHEFLIEFEHQMRGRYLVQCPQQPLFCLIKLFRPQLITKSVRARPK